MQNNNILFIDLDTHKVSTQVAYTEDARSTEVFHLGNINTDKQSFVKLARKTA
jgi:hypothetical protein